MTDGPTVAGRPAPGPLAALRGVGGVALGWVITVPYCAFFVLVSAVTLRRWAREMVPLVVRLWARMLLFLGGIRVVADNDSTLNERMGRVIIVNHPGTADLLWVPLLLPAGGTPVGKRQFMFMPGLNLAWWALRFALIDRSKPRHARRTLAALGDAAKRERLSVVLAPEGTRSRDGTIGPFKKGAFYMAMQAKLPIYPVVASGAFEVWPRHRSYPVPGTIRVRFLEPVGTADWEPERLADHVEEVRRQMVEALEALRASGGQVPGR